MADPATAPLPPTSAAGGPGFTPTGGYLTTSDLPTFGGVAQGAALAAQNAPVTDPAVRAALAARMYGQTANAISGGNLPGYNPADPSLVGRVAVPAGPNGGRDIGMVDPTMSPARQDVGQHYAQGAFDTRTAALTRAPGWAEHFKDYIGMGDGTDALTQRGNAASLYSQPAAQQYFSQHPDAVSHAEADPVGFAVKLGPILDAAVKGQKEGTASAAYITHPNGMQKVNTNPDLTKAIADGHGVSEGAAHAVTETHQYSWPEFLAATKGLTNRQAGQMWEMQHYLNPQQQALGSYLNTLTNGVNQAKAAGKPAEEAAAHKQLMDVLHLMATGYPQ